MPKLLLAVMATSMFSSTAFTQEQKTEEKKKTGNEGQAFGLSVENDSRNIAGPGSDQAYSNGVKFSYIYARDQIPKWAPDALTKSRLLKSEIEKASANFGLSLNHQIYTPNNTSVGYLIPTDRPYAGWLNLAASLHLKNPNRSQSMEASVGIVGPSALGQQVQNEFHTFIGTQRAQGWDNQLKDEPTFQLSYQQRINLYDLKAESGSWFDFIPMFGAGLGNVFIGGHIGAIARVGYNLPDDFGPARPSAAETDSFVSPQAPPRDRSNSYYLFAGLRGNAIAHNIFLDGNTYQTSHKVKKYPFTAETEVGLGTQIYPFTVVWRYVVRSPDFEENSGFNSFASIGITYFTK